jgi:hypothetical protein
VERAVRYLLALVAVVVGLVGIYVGVLMIAAPGLCENSCGSGTGLRIGGAVVIVLGFGIVAGGLYGAFKPRQA